MGSRIAAHFANAGVPALLLDLTAKDAAARNRDRHQAEPWRILHSRRRFSREAREFQRGTQYDLRLRLDTRSRD